MSQIPVIVNHAAESSKKCFHCGLRNFADQTRCTRCKYDLSLPLTEPRNNDQVPDNAGEFGRLKVSVVLIFAAVLLLGLALLYFRQDPQGTPVAASEAGVGQPATQQAEQTGQVIAQENAQSQAAAKHVLSGLKRFQGATEGSMSYEEYDEMLTRLKADLNNTLPSFVDHKPGAETFRREVDAAIRDYTAAGNWWKTTIRNSSVFTEADRTERLIASWTSAKTHLYNAEQMLVR